MGSFDMNASFSKMPIVDKTTVVICLKRKCKGHTSLIPIAYPVVGHYYDYGRVTNFEENEITEAICDFFEMDSMDDIIEFIYDMTIHGDYESGLEKINNGKEPYEKDKFYKYVNILDKLRKNIKIETEEEIENDINRLNDRHPERKELSKFLKILKENRLRDLNDIRELLDSYELALFYENTNVFDALCSVSNVWIEDGRLELHQEYDRGYNPIKVFGEYLVDKDNVFYITKDCYSHETIEIKKSLCRLYANFEIEGKHFEFTETSILGQEKCNYMWYKYGKAIHELWRNDINQYSRGYDIDKLDADYK